MTTRSPIKVNTTVILPHPGLSAASIGQSATSLSRAARVTCTSLAAGAIAEDRTAPAFHGLDRPRLRTATRRKSTEPEFLRIVTTAGAAAARSEERRVGKE